MSWYRCSGCGPSQKCDICGATECAQNFQSDCPGCVKAQEQAKGIVPWNMKRPPKGTRPTKHNRRWIRKEDSHRKKFIKANRMYEKSQGIDTWKFLLEL
jgi:hypothetical protein